MKTTRQKKQGSLLALTIIGAGIGILVVGSLLQLSLQDFSATEKEIGHAKSAQNLKLAHLIHTKSVQNYNAKNLTAPLKDEKKAALSDLIGGGVKQDAPNSIFGKNSVIPSLKQFGVVWDGIAEGKLSKITSTHENNETSSFRQGSKAVLSVTTPASTSKPLDFFGMLAFYKKDFDIVPQYRRTHLIGSIYTDGNFYLDCSPSRPDKTKDSTGIREMEKIVFHGLQGQSILITDKSVFRRGRNGQTLYHYKDPGHQHALPDLYKGGSVYNRNLGLNFSVYEDDDFAKLFYGEKVDYWAKLFIGNFYRGWRGNYPNKSLIFDKFLTSEFTNDEDSSQTPAKEAPHVDNADETLRRRFAGQGVTDPFGYVYTGVSKIKSSDTFDAPAVKSGDPAVPVIKFGKGEGTNKLVNFSKKMHPHQLMEDIQKDNTWDTVEYPDPNDSTKTLPSNYSEDSSGVLKETSMSALAALVIRDGCVYLREEPAGRLTMVRCYGNDPQVRYPNFGRERGTEIHPASGVATFTGTIYPAHPQQNPIYGDMRWYGWFGQYDSKPTEPSPSNPARWHFPIRTVTFNKGPSATPGEGGVDPIWASDTQGSISPTLEASHTYGPEDGCNYHEDARWIRTDVDLNEISGYPQFNADAGDATMGAGIGMWNNAYPTMSTGGIERFDPVRVAYNVVKAEVRRLYNLDHIYTSRHNGVRMLNRDGSLPAALAAPDVWGPIANGGMPFAAGVDYIGDGVADDYSAFWNDDGARVTLTEERQYRFRRSQANPTRAIDGILAPDGPIDDPVLSPELPNVARYSRHPALPIRAYTPKVELFPIRHKSLIDLNDPAQPNTQMTNWFIYKSTLPFSDRTLRMPADRECLTGWTWDSGNAPVAPLNYAAKLVNGVPIAPRMQNFGYAGATIGGAQGNGFGAAGHYNNPNALNTNFHNWYTLLNNAPEMLARRGSGVAGITFERDFHYNASDTGGYYGIDNLCMIDQQEKKIVVFTEIDLSEFTYECFRFNNIFPGAGFNGESNTITGKDKLQKIIYVVNTTMGKNFYGKRVHCGAVRIVRGHMLAHPLTIATTNALHVWGDFNYPGYGHHGVSYDDNLFYNVPTTKEHDPNTTYTIQPAALYADTIHAYPNNWIPFDPTSAEADYQSIFGDKAGNFQETTNGNNFNYFDTRLWWEDDGARGKLPFKSHGSKATGEFIDYKLDEAEAQIAPYASGQRFLNYHELIFKHANNDYYAKYSTDLADAPGDANNRREQSSLGKYGPQVIYAGLVYGGVESRLPSMFKKEDVDKVNKIVSRPPIVDELDWLMSWIPRANWEELTRDQMRDDDAVNNTLTKVGLKIPATPTGLYNVGGTLTLSDYYGRSFPSFEDCKIKFSGGGFSSNAVRHHVNHSYPAKSESSTSYPVQDINLNIFGSMVCLFDARQSTHGWNPTIIGTKKPELSYSYYTSKLDKNGHPEEGFYVPFKSNPPGTPSNDGKSSIGTEGKTTYSIEGTRLKY
jgi:hypothetical protein